MEFLHVAMLWIHITDKQLLLLARVVKLQLMQSDFWVRMK
jgi:hypothetical protein